MPDSNRTIAELARTLGVSHARAREILLTVDQLRAGGTLFTAMPPESSGASDTLDLAALDDSSLHTIPTLAGEDPTPSATHPPMQNIIATRYEELGLLGRGGMGEVYKVRDRRFDRILALKVMRADRYQRDDFVGPFLREARIEARLQHPGIPPVYDRGELPDGRPWYTMKRVEGERLSDAIAALHSAPRGSEQASGLFRQVLRAFEVVCRTVAYAHKQGVVHRDIKPANIMLGEFGEVLVLDWGLALELEHFATDLSSSIPVVGTPSYMSPEQARGERTSVAPSTDIYALGATLYHILVGRPPFHGQLGRHTRDRLAANERPRPIPREDEGTHPPQLVSLCEQAMQVVAADRMEAAEDIAEGIQAWLAAAERQERGRQELAHAAELRAQSGVEHRRAVSLWSEASQLLRQNASPTSPGWARWRKARAAFLHAKRLQEQQTRSLEASLAHYSELQESRERLARHYAEVALKARERGAIDRAREAHERMLQHIRVLARPRAQELQTELESYRQTPLYIERARRGSQIGREQLRDVLLEMHANLARFISLHGEPGVGKSSVLLEHGLQLRDSAVQVIYVDAQSIEDLHSVEQSVGQAIESGALEAQPSTPLHTLIGGRRLLLLLDNVDQCRDAVVGLVNAWLEHCPGLQVVCTSRVPLAHGRVHPVRVPQLDRLGAIDLLIRHALRADPDLNADRLPEDDLIAVVERLDGIPLAIELAASRLSSFRLDELRARLDQRLDLLRSGGDKAGGLDAAMAISWESLSTSAQTTLAQASLFRSGMDRAAAEEVLLLPDGAQEIWSCLEELVQHNLLRAVRTDNDRTRYMLSETVWSWADARLREESEESLRQQLVRRHARYFAAMHADASEAYASFEQAFELENFVLAAHRGPPEDALSCAQLACTILLAKGPVQRSVDLLEALLERDDLQHGHRRTLLILLGRCLRTAGRMQEARARLQQAQFLHGSPHPDEEARVNPRAEDAELSVAQALADGLVAVEEHRYPDARQSYERALEGARELDKLGAQAQALAGLSRLPPSSEAPDQSQKHFEAAVELARKADDPPLALEIIGNYGLSLARRGLLDKALACFEEAELGHRQLKNVHAVAAFSMNQGILLQRLGRNMAAMAAFDRSIEACEQGKDHRIRAAVLGAKASLASRQGLYSEAYRLASDALAWQMAHGDSALARRSRRMLAGICIDMGELVQAEQLLGELTKDDALKDPTERISLDINRAALLLSTGERTEGARALLEEAVQAATEHGLDNLRMLALVNLGDALAQHGLEGPASERFEQAIQLSQTDDSLAELAGVALGSLSVIRARAGDPTRAQQLHQEAGRRLQDWALERLRWTIQGGLLAAHQGDNLRALHALTDARQTVDRLGIGRQSTVHALLSRLEGLLRDRRSDLSATIHLQPAHAHDEQRRMLTGLAELALLEQEVFQLTAAEQLLDKAEALARKLDEPVLLTEIYAQRLNIARERAYYDEAARFGALALALTAKTGNQAQELKIRTNLGVVAMESADFELSRTHLRAAWDIGEALEDDKGCALVQSNLGNLFFAQRQYARAEVEFREAEEAFDRMGMDRYGMLTRGNRGDALLRLHRLDEAANLLEDAAHRAALHRHDVAQAAFLGALAETRARQGRGTEALKALQQGLSLPVHVPVEKLKLLSRAAIVEALAGKRSRGMARLEEARILSDRLETKLAGDLLHLLQLAQGLLSASRRADAPAPVEPP